MAQRVDRANTDYLSSYNQVQAVVASLNRDIDILAWTKALSQNRLKFIYFQQMLFPVKKKSILHDFRFTRIDAWLSPSEYLLNQVKMNTNILDEKLIKVPLGIETASFLQAKSKRADVKIEWGLSPDKNYIGLLGRIDPMKGQALLIEAFGRLKNRFPNWNLLFVGETSLHLKTDVYSKKVTEEINRQELTERVRFLPFTNEPWKFFAATDV
ncbi:MAG: glycosyltransferase, partial [Chitinophagia bacterium]|nr:glycosyltransferase [Chitinophagia bacterium]